MFTTALALYILESDGHAVFNTLSQPPTWRDVGAVQQPGRVGLPQLHAHLSRLQIVQQRLRVLGAEEVLVPQLQSSGSGPLLRNLLQKRQSRLTRPRVREVGQGTVSKSCCAMCLCSEDSHTVMPCDWLYM